MSKKKPTYFSCVMTIEFREGRKDPIVILT